MKLSYLDVIKHFRTPAELARRLGIKPQAVYQWGGEIPALRQYQIAELIAADEASTAQSASQVA